MNWLFYINSQAYTGLSNPARILTSVLLILMSVTVIFVTLRGKEKDNEDKF